MIFGLISWVVFGLLAGILAKFLLPGKDRGGCIVTSLIGIAGAVIGGLVATQFGYGGISVAPWDDWRGFVIAVLGALLLLIVFRLLFGKKK